MKIGLPALVHQALEAIDPRVIDWRKSNNGRKLTWVSALTQGDFESTVKSSRRAERAAAMLQLGLLLHTAAWHAHSLDRTRSDLPFGNPAGHSGDLMEEMQMHQATKLSFRSEVLSPLLMGGAVLVFGACLATFIAWISSGKPEVWDTLLILLSIECAVLCLLVGALWLNYRFTWPDAPGFQANSWRGRLRAWLLADYGHEMMYHLAMGALYVCAACALGISMARLIGRAG